MKRPKIFLCMIIIAVLFWQGGVSAFERRLGTRPMAMGDAFTALADDMNAMNYNPAGLGQLARLAVSMEYANLYPGLDDGRLQENHFAFAAGANGGGFGMAWNNRSLSGIYHENEFLMGYGRRLGDWPAWLGLNAKLFYLAYTDQSGIQAGGYFSSGETQKWQFDLDAGGLVRIIAQTPERPEINLGLAISNLTQPDLGIRAEDRLALNIRAGVGAVFREYDGAVDFVYHDDAYELHAGLERWFLGNDLGVRFGILGGERLGTLLTMGGSYRFAFSSLDLQMSYGFQLPLQGLMETVGTHRLSLDLLSRPMAKKPEVKKPEAKKPEEKVRPQPTVAPVRKPAAARAKVGEAREYLKQQVALLKTTRKRLDALAAKNRNTYAAAEIRKAQKKLQNAVRLLTQEKDVPGFVEALKTVVDAVKKIERKVAP